MNKLTSNILYFKFNNFIIFYDRAYFLTVFSTFYKKFDLFLSRSGFFEKLKKEVYKIYITQLSSEF